MKLIAVDFDGTLSKGDSTKIFFSYMSKNSIDFIWNYYLRYTLIIVYSIIARNYLLLKRKRWTWVQEKWFQCNRGFFKELLRNQLNENVIEAIGNINENGFKVVVVSAGIRELMQEVCQELGYHLIAKSIFDLSNVEIEGKEKVNWLQIAYPRCSVIYAFGNSQGDSEMLKYSDNPYWVDPLGNVVKYSG